jgi:hypothetical protein
VQHTENDINVFFSQAHHLEPADAPRERSAISMLDNGRNNGTGRALSKDALHVGGSWGSEGAVDKRKKEQVDMFNGITSCSCENSDLCSIQCSQEFFYEREAERRLLYQDQRLHSTIVLLLISLITTADGQLDHRYFPREPAASGAGQQYSDMDLCMVLYYHLNHSRCKALLCDLLQGVHALGDGACRLLKLLVHALFPVHVFGRERKHLARGTFSYVQRQHMLFCGNLHHYVAEKVRCRSLSPYSVRFKSIATLAPAVQ